MARTGRPTKYKPEMCESALELFKEGASISEICLELDICRDTFYEWLKKHEDFADTVKRGLQFSKGWWERLGRKGAAGLAEVNQVLWFMNMKNRFGNDNPTENIVWRDKQEVDQNNTGQMKIEIVRFADTE